MRAIVGTAAKPLAGSLMTHEISLSLVGIGIGRYIYVVGDGIFDHRRILAGEVVFDNAVYEFIAVDGHTVRTIVELRGGAQHVVAEKYTHGAGAGILLQEINSHRCHCLGAVFIFVGGIGAAGFAAVVFHGCEVHAPFGKIFSAGIINGFRCRHGLHTFGLTLETGYFGGDVGTRREVLYPQLGGAHCVALVGGYGSYFGIVVGGVPVGQTGLLRKMNEVDAVAGEEHHLATGLFYCKVRTIVDYIILICVVEQLLHQFIVFIARSSVAFRAKQATARRHFACAIYVTAEEMYYEEFRRMLIKEGYHILYRFFKSFISLSQAVVAI